MNNPRKMACHVWEGGAYICEQEDQDAADGGIAEPPGLGGDLSVERLDRDAAVVLEARHELARHQRARARRQREHPVAERHRDEGMAHRRRQSAVDHDRDDVGIGPQLPGHEVGVYVEIDCGAGRVNQGLMQFVTYGPTRQPLLLDPDPRVLEERVWRVDTPFSGRIDRVGSRTIDAVWGGACVRA